MRNRTANPERCDVEAVEPDLQRALDEARVDHRVALVLPDPISPFEFAIACEVFGIRRGEVLASMAHPRWYDLTICAARPGAEVQTGLGFTLKVDRGLDALDEADTVIVPMTSKHSLSEAQRLGWRTPDLPTDPVLEALARAGERGARMVSYCSGAFALAEAGLLDGKRATTHWLYLDSFRERYPRVEVVPDVLYVDEGNVLTSAGSGAAIDLSLHIVRSDRGADVADLVARRMVVPPHRDGGQAQYTRVPPVERTGQQFSALLQWITEHLADDLSVADLASRASMSERTFARKFREATGTTPLAWITGQRVARAQQLLETTDLTVDAVASRSGLGSATNLRTRLRDACGVSPSTYRARFRRVA